MDASIKHSEALKARYPPSLCADTFLVRSGTDPPAVSSDCPARAPMTGHYHLDQGRPPGTGGQRFIQGCLPSAVWGWGRERERQTLGRSTACTLGEPGPEPASPGPPGGSPARPSSRSSPRLRGLTRRGHRRLAPEPGSGFKRASSLASVRTDAPPRPSAAPPAPRPGHGLTGKAHSRPRPGRWPLAPAPLPAAPARGRGYGGPWRERRHYPNAAAGPARGLIPGFSAESRSLSRRGRPTAQRCRHGGCNDGRGGRMRRVS